MAGTKDGIKPEMVIEFLKSHFKSRIEGLERAKGGNIKVSYFFGCEGRDYIVRFSKENKEFELEDFLYKRFAGAHIPMSGIVKTGCWEGLFYCISYRAQGITMNQLDGKQICGVMPDLIKKAAKIHLTDITGTLGYGWISTGGNGSYESFGGFAMAHFHKEQSGFWKDWHNLFENGSLKKSTFTDLYREMTGLIKYCEGRRSIVHGDFHLGNIITDYSKITAIIDWANALYGDPLLDIAAIHMQCPQYSIADLFRECYEIKGIAGENFHERFICCSLFKGLDAMRFSAKFGRLQSCASISSYLLDLMR